MIHINQSLSFQFNFSTSIFYPSFLPKWQRRYTVKLKGEDLWSDTKHKQNKTMSRPTKPKLKWEFNWSFWSRIKFFYTGLRLYTDEHKQLSYCKITSNNQAAVTYLAFSPSVPLWRSQRRLSHTGTLETSANRFFFRSQAGCQQAHGPLPQLSWWKPPHHAMARLLPMSGVPSSAQTPRSFTFPGELNQAWGLNWGGSAATQLLLLKKFTYLQSLYFIWTCVHGLKNSAVEHP